MNKKSLIIIVIILAVAIFLVWYSVASKTPITPVAIPEGVLLFYGEDCPHCQNVESFIKGNQIDQKVDFKNFEIPFNGKTSKELIENAGILVSAAQNCGIDSSKGVSIPFLYDGKGSCLTGDADVINFFKNAADIK